MRASLVSREVIADSIELMAHAHDFDALVCLVGCDKTVPAALMALARLDKPAVVLYSGPMRAGPRGNVTIQDVWEAVGAEERGLIDARRARRARARRVPRRRARAPATSRRTRWRSRSTASASRSRATGSCSAVDLEAKAAAARRAGALAAGPLPSARTFLDRRALLNAMTGIAATGGSTNGVLHLLAIAREARRRADARRPGRRRRRARR